MQRPWVPSLEPQRRKYDQIPVASGVNSFFYSALLQATRKGYSPVLCFRHPAIFHMATGDCPRTVHPIRINTAAKSSSQARLPCCSTHPVEQWLLSGCLTGVQAVPWPSFVSCFGESKEGRPTRVRPLSSAVLTTPAPGGRIRERRHPAESSGLAFLSGGQQRTGTSQGHARNPHAVT